MRTESKARNVLVGGQQTNSSLVGVEKFDHSSTVDKVIPVGVEMFFSIFTDIEKYFGFVISEKNKLFFEVDFIECFSVFFELVFGEWCVHIGL